GRKSGFTHLLGGLAGAAPVVVGWLLVNPALSPTLLFLVLLVLVWVPLHVWSLMLSYREDYLGGGVRIFPVSWRVADAVKVLWGLCFLLYGVSLSGYLMMAPGWLYLAVANLLGLGLVYAGYRLWRGRGRGEAWRLYRLLTYPYLGIMFVVIMFDVGVI
ncbi:MAG: UbiA family prenyltransferase, partial [Dehalococcoidia bacterium]|nr:UbiA family prenyltransferase [Dehalococcoidia bacterium]